MSLLVSCVSTSFSPEAVAIKQDPTRTSQRAEVRAAASTGRGHTEFKKKINKKNVQP